LSLDFQKSVTYHQICLDLLIYLRG
jgi:hypothetical protein